MKFARAYTLIEVLIALAIISIAFVAIFNALHVSTHSQEQLQQRSLALHSAQNILTELKLQRIFPEPGKQTRQCAQAAYAFVCEIDIEKTVNSHFRQVKVTVLNPQTQLQAAHLYGTISRLP